MNGKSPMGAQSLTRRNDEAASTLPAPDSSNVRQVARSQVKKYKDKDNPQMKKVEEVSEHQSGADPTSRG